MPELISVGLDVGTTTTQMVVSRLRAVNTASAFSVPKMEITHREILYQSPIHFTPLIRDELIDGQGIRKIVEAEYQKAGITPQTVDTGAVIITGETSRKENAESVLHALSKLAGDFVVATAGPDLESILAAKGAGAVEASEKGPVLHFDIGGGTSNLALCIDGKVAATGCLNIGARAKPSPASLPPGGSCPSAHTGADEECGQQCTGLYAETDLSCSGFCRHSSPTAPRSPLSVCDARQKHRLSKQARFLPTAAHAAPSLSPPLAAVRLAAPGEGIRNARETAHYYATILEMAAGLRPKTADYYRYLTPGTRDIPTVPNMTISFSGGVADCIEKEIPPDAYGDLGPLLGRAIKESRLCQGPYRLGSHTIRATVIGAGCHSARLSGSTIFRQNTPLPVKNLPVCVLTEAEQERPDLRELIQGKLSALDTPGAVFLPGWTAPAYRRVTALADMLQEFHCPILLEADMAKVLGNALALRLPPDTPILCLDGLSVPEGSFLDIGTPVGSSLTVIIKTLIFEH